MTLIHHDGSREVYPSIQAAIDAADSLETVELAYGVYAGDGNRDVDYRGKAITLKSQSGVPEDCIIDCQRRGRGFLFESGESATAILEGVKIINGYVWPDSEGKLGNGGAIVCFGGASPTIRNCVFSSNQAKDNGGAIRVSFSSFPQISNCMFLGNKTQSCGGAISVHWGGGGRIQSCQFSGNWAPLGGAMDCQLYTPLKAEECTFYANSAGFGGAIYCHEATPEFTNCTFALNECHQNGRGAAIHCADGGGLRLARTIIAHCDNGVGIAIDDSSAVFAIECCDIVGNEGGDWVDRLCNMLGVDGNICADPLFQDLEGGNLHLSSGSPCLPNGGGCGLIGAWGEAK